MTQTLTIDIWSDVMCPWCLVGWGGLRQALDQLDGEIDAQVRWHAFELNPDMPEEGEERTAHIARGRDGAGRGGLVPPRGWGAALAGRDAPIVAPPPHTIAHQLFRWWIAQ
ncbi:hypothetical protein VM77_07635 [Citromicrobium sp. JL31]|uniref:DsbA family protein n=1 Tax=Citromicrobium sp. JL31 TaxID=1628321 RepID=UPI0006C9285D|nr:DsbA family protein [Citromicrobium sp. JL31]KPM19229.1 hypothetical protein VM77_07635 [Citromicrobium sp. JL31]